MSTPGNKQSKTPGTNSANFRTFTNGANNRKPVGNEPNEAGQQKRSNASPSSPSLNSVSPSSGNRTNSGRWNNNNNPNPNSNNINNNGNKSNLNRTRSNMGGSRYHLSAPHEKEDHAKHMHDRLVYVIGKSVGSHAIVTVSSGARYKGVLVGANTENEEFGIVLKLASLFSPAPGDSDLSAEEKVKTIETLVVTYKDFMDLQILDTNIVPEVNEGISVSTGPVSSSGPAGGLNYRVGNDSKRDGFRTDTDISGHRKLEERELKPWSADEHSSLSGGLDDLSLNNSSGNNASWDQFAVNQQKFGVKSTFDEHYYTTKIDKSHPEYMERAKRAEKLAKEIENQAHGGNVHLAEERGLVVDDSGLDEEDKYSGVDRKSESSNKRASASASGKYVPGALQAAKAAAAASEREKSASPVHHDPAIISMNSDGKVATTDASNPTEQDKAAMEKLHQQLFASASAFEVKETSSEPEVKAMVSAPGSSVPAVASSVSTQQSGTVAKKPGMEEELAGKFRQFVSAESKKLERKLDQHKQLNQKKEMDEKFNDFKKFSADYKINAPVPADLVPILAKDREKQDEIIYKSTSPTISKKSKIPSPLPAKAVVETGSKKPAFNFKAREFKPMNPSASSFTPSSPSPGNINIVPISSSVNSAIAANSPSQASSSRGGPNGSNSATPVSKQVRVVAPSVFFGSKQPKPLESRISIKDKFNPFKRAKENHVSTFPFKIEKPFDPPTWLPASEKEIDDFFPSFDSFMGRRPFFSQMSRGPNPGSVNPNSPNGMHGMPLFQPPMDGMNMPGASGGGTSPPGFYPYMPNGGYSNQPYPQNYPYGGSGNRGSGAGGPMIGMNMGGMNMNMMGGMGMNMGMMPPGAYMPPPLPGPGPGGPGSSQGGSAYNSPRNANTMLMPQGGYNANVMMSPGSGSGGHGHGRPQYNASRGNNTTNLQSHNQGIHADKTEISDPVEESS